MRLPNLLAVIAGVLLLLLACAVLVLSAPDNPLWRYDRYVLEGTFTGNSCSLTLDGRPIAGDESLGSRIIIPRDYTAHLIGPGGAVMPDTKGMPQYQGIFCRGLRATIEKPSLTHTGEGRYGIVENVTDVGPRVAAVTLSSNDVDPGWWPFALGGAKLVGREGRLTITAVTDSTVRGAFRVVARRHTMGFGG